MFAEWVADKDAESINVDQNVYFLFKHLSSYNNKDLFLVLVAVGISTHGDH